MQPVPDPLERLHAKLATVNDLAFALVPQSPEESVRELMEALREAVALAGELKGVSARSTGCQEHPQGPVDPVAPVGWGVCLLCNTRRHRGVRRRPPDSFGVRGA